MYITEFIQTELHPIVLDCMDAFKMLHYDE